LVLPTRAGTLFVGGTASLSIELRTVESDASSLTALRVAPGDAT
jgi:hypothetical protein